MMVKTQGTCELVSENGCAVPAGMMGGGKKMYKGKTCAVAMKLHDAMRGVSSKPVVPPTPLKPTFSKPVVMDGSRRRPPPLTPPKPVAKEETKEETVEEKVEEKDGEKDGGGVDRLIRKGERESGCCKDFKATCMACAAEMSIEKYCAHNPRMTGCERKPAAASESESGSERSPRPLSNREAARRYSERNMLTAEHAAAVNALTEEH